MHLFKVGDRKDCFLSYLFNGHTDGSTRLHVLFNVYLLFVGIVLYNGIKLELHFSS